MNKKQVIITVPVYRLPLPPEEEISLCHLKKFLNGYDITLVAPKSLKLQGEHLTSMPVVRFADEYFKDIAGYNKLMLSREFYGRFKKYKYILIYQLDCLVFSRDLDQWCEKGFDYIGAPWFRSYGEDTSEGLWRVGNGGLSLRRVDKFLAVLNS